MRFSLCLFVLIHASVIYAGSASSIPSIFSQYACHRSDPKLNECLLKSGDAVFPLLANGVPEAKIEPLDPLNVEFMTAEGEAESVKVKMVMKNITMFGTSTAKFNKVKFDPASLSGEVSFHIPYTRMLTEYYASGRLFVIPLESSAHFDGSFTDLDINFIFRLKTVQRKGKEYFSLDKLTMKMRVETAKIKLTSVDPNQQASVDLIQNFFNENDRLVLDTVNPIANLNGAEFYKHTIERTLRVVPANVLLPN